MFKFKNVFLFGFVAVFVVGSLLVTEKADSGFFGNLFGAKKNGNNSSSQQANVNESKNENKAIQSQSMESGITAGVSIMKKGDGYAVIAGGANVKTVSVSGDVYTITAEASFGSSKFIWTLNATASNTKVTRLYGAPSTLSEISIGNNLSFNGLLDATKTSFTVNATEIRNFSVQLKDAQYNGVITATSTLNFFMLKDAKVSGDIKVIVDANTKIQSKLSEETNAPKHDITFSDLKPGMIVLNAQGVVDTTKAPVELKAKQILVVPKDAQQKEESQTGIIQSIDGKKIPTTMKILSSGGKTFTVNMDSRTAFLTTKGTWKTGVGGQGFFEALKVKDSVWIDGTLIIKTGIINATTVWQKIK